MNLKEAIESGKPFKRPSWKKSPTGWEPWIITKYAQNPNTELVFESNKSNWTPRKDDIMANDYVLKEEKKKMRSSIQVLFDEFSHEQIKGMAKEVIELWQKGYLNKYHNILDFRQLLIDEGYPKGVVRSLAENTIIQVSLGVFAALPMSFPYDDKVEEIMKTIL